MHDLQQKHKATVIKKRSTTKELEDQINALKSRIDHLKSLARSTESINLTEEEKARKLEKTY